MSFRQKHLTDIAQNISQDSPASGFGEGKMALSNLNRRYIGSILIITLLVVLAGVVSGCYDFSQFPSLNATVEKPGKVAPPTVISTKDRAVLAVYEHLLNRAKGHKAKLYLAEFYAACDNWSAESELFKDGSSVWYVLVDMTSNKTWKWKPYWQQASWFVFKDGKVIPCNRIQANALRIEADLEELSLPP